MCCSTTLPNPERARMRMYIQSTWCRRSRARGEARWPVVWKAQLFLWSCVQSVVERWKTLNKGARRSRFAMDVSVATRRYDSALPKANTNARSWSDCWLVFKLTDRVLLHLWPRAFAIEAETHNAHLVFSHLVIVYLRTFYCCVCMPNNPSPSNKKSCG